MLNEPQNWSLSLSPSNTSYTLSLGKGAGPSRNKHSAGIYVLSGGFSSFSWGILGCVWTSTRLYFCSGVSQLSHTEEASLLHQTHPLLHLWCHLLLGIGCPVMSKECCCQRTESPCLAQSRRSTCLEWAAGRAAPALLPPVPHSWRFPLAAYVTVSEAGEVTPGGCFDPVVSPLLSSLMLSGRICSSLFSAGEAGRALWHTHRSCCAGISGQMEARAVTGGVIRNTILSRRSAFAFKETRVCSAFRWLPQWHPSLSGPSYSNTPSFAFPA